MSVKRIPSLSQRYTAKVIRETEKNDFYVASGMRNAGKQYKRDKMKAKQRVYEDLDDGLDAMEGEMDL